jgi:hypothetical protein
MRLISQVPFLLALALISASVSAQVSSKKDVLILNEVGLSHSLTDVMTQQIVSGVERTAGRDVEFFSESLDLLSLPDRPSLAEARDWLVKKYGGRKLEVVVAVGPDTIKFLADYGRTLFLGVPVVICGSASDQVGSPSLDSRFTRAREDTRSGLASFSKYPPRVCGWRNLGL